MSTRPIIALRTLPSNEHLKQALRAVGGDFRRVIDQGNVSLDAHADHLSRLRFLEHGPRPIVCVTDPAPFGTALAQRVLIEERVPALARATWLIALSAPQGPVLDRTLIRSRESADTPDSVPIWESLCGRRFVVVRPAAALTRVRTRCAEVDALRLL